MDFNIFAIGIIIGLIIDSVWWHLPYKKIEKGYEIMEHYHFALIVGMFTVITGNPIFAGIMVALFLGEWSQDHQFAYGSTHFKSSTIVGGLLFGILLAITFGWNLIGI